MQLTWVEQVQAGFNCLVKNRLHLFNFSRTCMEIITLWARPKMTSRFLRGESQGFCDGSTKALVIKSVMMEDWGHKLSKIAWRHLWKTTKVKAHYCIFFVWKYQHEHGEHIKMGNNIRHLLKTDGIRKLVN